ncbi:MAG: histidine--tRNA ligase [Spirochaetales bacterium]|uniref:histidine--tRNA ligase n=1 Tax=Bullifex sp. TaxID=2815808 RepID=UPI002A585BCB|nr:histidine--tRNA ligase [Bullifex sp.]MDD5973648.1 histidine--tRNA ligase [Spirochaetales bacterium]MDD7270789.1 histidine--tRNA ligase [Spirochaetales bacterium]MDY4067173.1 histidine--tRNA ligase [Bullifex sp.]
MIEPLVLKGFRDSLPKTEIPRRKIMRMLEDVFTSYGFVPIDTPALEYTNVLLGKGGGETDKQIFHFQDNGKREVAMRFDLTVPFARFLATNYSMLPIPFKRYHMSKVWRGENPQKGRYREFIQCDFDMVGADNALSDYEILSLMDTSFKTLNIERYTFHVSHRGLFNTFLEHNDILDKSVDILRLVDKLRKIGEEEVIKQLIELTGSEEKAKKIISYISRSEDEKFLDCVARLEDLAGGECDASIRLKEIYALLKEAGIEKHFILDPSITRGLDYYTGIVYETFLDDLPSIGSVCSGGRYNNLTSLYSKESLPGVGSSIGLDRLLAALEELKHPLLKEVSNADVVIYAKEGQEAKAVKCASILRREGLKTDTYLLPGKKMKAFYDYTSKCGSRYVIMFDDEGKESLKDLITRDTTAADINTIVAILKENRS